MLLLNSTSKGIDLKASQRVNISINNYLHLLSIVVCTMCHSSLFKKKFVCEGAINPLKMRKCRVLTGYLFTPGLFSIGHKGVNRGAEVHFSLTFSSSQKCGVNAYRLPRKEASYLHP